MSNAKVGASWSRHSFGKVTEVTAQAVTVKNEAGKTWQVDPKLFQDEFKTSSENDFSKVEKLSRTEVIQKFEGFVGQAVTVNFNKKVDAKELISKAEGLASKKSIITLLKASLDGEERTMVGYHKGNHDDFGRLHFKEMDSGMKLVDPRTINWFVTDGIKYMVK